ncbi:MAG: hypothetical protein VYB50_04525 [Candidatus Thermoplasmatota archaeon]|nr:hypothetical protein [Candidatus Thermoplasmatota archaeon]
MHSDARAFGPSGSEQAEIFRSLTLGGYKGRVKARLSQSQITFECRSGHALDLQLSGIQRMHHTHTNLIPGWLAVIGLLCLWMAWRTLNGDLQLYAAGLGLFLSGGHLLTKRPTLTLDTIAGDCHSVFGNDSLLMKLCTMIQRLQDGASMADARRGLELLSKEAAYPRTSQLEQNRRKEPIVMESNPAIEAFLQTIDTEGETLEQKASFQPDMNLPEWINNVNESSESKKEIPPGLLHRSRENLHTRRDHPQPPMPQPQAPYPGVYRQEYPISQPSQHFDHWPQQDYTMAQTKPQLTPPPERYLPSFIGADGAHIPDQDTVVSKPEDDLSIEMNLELKQEESSLVASARKNESDMKSVNKMNFEQTEKFPHVSKIVNGRVPRRLKLRSSNISKSKDKLKRKIFGNRPISRILSSRTADSLRLQANRNQRAQISDKIQSLADERTGPLNQEHVELMTAHLDQPTKPIPDSFQELTETKSPKKISALDLPTLEN